MKADRNGLTADSLLIINCISLNVHLNNKKRQTFYKSNFHAKVKVCELSLLSVHYNFCPFILWWVEDKMCLKIYTYFSSCKPKLSKKFLLASSDSFNIMLYLDKKKYVNRALANTSKIYPNEKLNMLI